MQVLQSQEEGPGSKNCELIQVRQSVHEGGEVGDQLHGPGQGVRAGGGLRLHSLL